MDNFSVRFIVSVVRYAHKTPSRRKVALGGIRGRIFSWGVLLPLMVRSNGSRNLKLNPRLVGTNVQNWASALQFSSLRSRFPVHLADFSRYVEPAPPQEFLYTLLPQKVAISKMDGVGGKPGWAWIFILEGLATVVAGSMSFWIIQDFPDSAKFLTDAERSFVIRRLQTDDQYSAVGEEFKAKYIWQSLSNWKTYVTSKEDFLFLNLFA